jgi:ribonuclease E
MSKQIIIAEQHRIAAVFSEDQIQELIVATGHHQVGDIYLGIVENVLPGIDAAFVNIGDSDRNGFIHVTDLGPLRLKRAAASITDLLAPQQKVLVQVMKEPTGNKGPRLTGNVSLPGRYLVLMPFGRGVNLSRRIRSESARNRLRALAILVKPAGMGLLVRTEAEGVAEEAIIEDLEALQKQWETVQQEAVSTRPPALLNRDDDFIQRVLRDMYSADVNRIVVDSSTGVKRVKQHLVNWSSGKPPQGVLVDHHRDRISILEFFRVNAAIREALKPRVDLPSGGYIIIERTEALTVIDVNSGSFTRSATARETVLWTNSEAATEIARQLRLRNIAGVIIVDFIDMDSRRDQMQVLEQFNKVLRSDKARPQIAQLTELGLVELTRKRQGQNIYELFGRTCPTCGGLGHLVHLPGETERIAPEPIESSRPLVPNLRTASPLPEPWDGGDDYEADASSDLQELDLTNHPSYQERSGANNSNRRRRRRIGREPMARESITREPAHREPVTRELITRELIPRNNRLESDFEESTTPSLDIEDSILSLPEVEAVVPKENRIEKTERHRTNRRDRPAAEPPQVIAVEMTQEEQDVYALMGVSPLVLTPEAVRDPKSIVIRVKLPGESDPISDEVAVVQTPTAATASSRIELTAVNRSRTPLPRIASELISPELISSAEPVLSNLDSDAVAATPKPLLESPTQVDVPINGGESEEDSDNAIVRRRRRRRSSAETGMALDPDINENGD